MAGNTFGHTFRLTSFGESHGKAIGGVIDGCPAGLEIDFDFINKELTRRRPGYSKLASERKESDTIEFLSGIYEGVTTGTPIGFIIRNSDTKSSDYDALKDVYRPSHADYTYDKKYGFRDHRGGGRASARETAIRVAGGAIAKTLLQKYQIKIQAYVSSVGSISLDKSYKELDLDLTEQSQLRCPDLEISSKMRDLILEQKNAGDTLGGTITCIIKNVPAGLGEPVFNKLEANLAFAMMSINAVKGFEIGSGFDSSKMKGSEHNDIFTGDTGNISTLSNHSGGIQGGISNGQDIFFKVAFKPVATLKQRQDTVDKDGKQVKIEAGGRHDVCVVPRAVPIVENMAALVLADFYLQNNNSRI